MRDFDTFVRNLNDAWLKNDLADLRNYFHENVVMLLPDGRSCVHGVDAVIDSYRQFLDAGKIHSFDCTRIEVHCFAETAVCHYYYEVDYEIEHGRFQESGVEVYVLVTGDKPRVVWKTQITIPDKGIT